jgi:hypothetical protein
LLSLTTKPPSLFIKTKFAKNENQKSKSTESYIV